MLTPTPDIPNNSWIIARGRQQLHSPVRNAHMMYPSSPFTCSQAPSRLHTGAPISVFKLSWGPAVEYEIQACCPSAKQIMLVKNPHPFGLSCSRCWWWCAISLVSTTQSSISLSDIHIKDKDIIPMLSSPPRFEVSSSELDDMVRLLSKWHKRRRNKTIVSTKTIPFCTKHLA